MDVYFRDTFQALRTKSNVPLQHQTSYLCLFCLLHTERPFPVVNPNPALIIRVSSPSFPLHPLYYFDQVSKHRPLTNKFWVLQAYQILHSQPLCQQPPHLPHNFIHTISKLPFLPLDNLPGLQRPYAIRHRPVHITLIHQPPQRTHHPLKCLT